MYILDGVMQLFIVHSLLYRVPVLSATTTLGNGQSHVCWKLLQILAKSTNSSTQQQLLASPQILRMSHNPPNPELLDVLDEAGMVVWAETRNFGDNRQWLLDFAEAELVSRCSEIAVVKSQMYAKCLPYIASEAPPTPWRTKAMP
jgi:hypothetical protein